MESFKFKLVSIQKMENDAYWAKNFEVALDDTTVLKFTVSNKAPVNNNTYKTNSNLLAFPIPYKELKANIEACLFEDKNLIIKPAGSIEEVLTIEFPFKFINKDSRDQLDFLSKKITSNLSKVNTINSFINAANEEN
ncbi:MAG: hypothetical protein J0H68_00170 [Sphingobacteriia bacterium]|nr:hypothetical protein [Sphingobacteriia bacterium]